MNEKPKREKSRGEIIADHKENHLCYRCIHAPFCVMARAMLPEYLTTITSCHGFVDVEALRSTGRG